MCFTRVIFVAMWRRDGIEVRLGIRDTYLTDQVVPFIRKIADDCTIYYNGDSGRKGASCVWELMEYR